MKRKLYLAASFALLSGGLLTGCGDDSDTSSDATQQEAAENLAGAMLKYIPEGSPYFLANRETLPEQEVFDNYRRTQGIDLDAQLDELREELETTNDKGTKALLTLLLALGEEFTDVETLDDLHGLGIDASPYMAFYGLGIMPVLRVELADGDAFRTTLERALEKAEISPRTESTNDTDYWVLTPEDDVKIIMAIVDQQLVLSLVPSDANDELLAQVLGDDLPDDNIGDSGALEALEERHGFTAYGAGEIDSARLMDELSDPSHEGTRALLAANDEEPMDLSSCQADIDRITSRFPGLAMGSRAYDPSGHAELNLILETDDAIVSDLRGITAAVPGLGNNEGMASFGLGLNLPALMEAVQKYSRQMRENPFSCAELQELNSTWDDANMALNNPATMMLGPALTGFNARIDSLYMKGANPTVTGLMTLASNNPMGLLNSVSSFMPELSSLGLRPGGEPQRVESAMLPPEIPAMYAAMSDSAIGISVGSDAPSSLQEELQVDTTDSNLLMHTHVSGDFFQAMASIAEQAPSNEFSAADIEMFQQYSEVYDNVATWVTIGDAGVELNFSVDMSDEVDAQD